MARAKITLNNIALPLGTLKWQFKSGVEFYDTTIMVPDKIAKSIWQVRNDGINDLATLVFDNGTDKATIKGIVIAMVSKTQKKKSLSVANEGMSAVRLADRRFYWQHRKWHGSYNQLKAVNWRIALEGVPNKALDHFTFNWKAYKLWSIETILRDSKGNVINVVHKPWGVLELLGLVLRELEPDNYLGIFGDIEKFNNLTPNQLNFAGMPVTQVLKQLAYYARAGIGIDTDGKIYIYPEEDET